MNDVKWIRLLFLIWWAYVLPWYDHRGWLDVQYEESVNSEFADLHLLSYYELITRITSGTVRREARRRGQCSQYVRTVSAANLAWAEFAFLCAINHLHSAPHRVIQPSVFRPTGAVNTCCLLFTAHVPISHDICSYIPRYLYPVEYIRTNATRLKTGLARWLSLTLSHNFISMKPPEVWQFFWSRSMIPWT